MSAKIYLFSTCKHYKIYIL